MVAARPQPFQLLIADDDAQFREVLRSLLEPFFTLLEASSGEQAIEIVADERVDLLLLDMHMDRLTGLQTIQIVKSIDETKPCILITADATEDLVREATQADAYSVLSKPVRKLVLFQTLETALVETYHDLPLGWPKSLAN